jgi:signal transduction histidine kinase
MFQNLISNAVKYAGEKSPEILVQAKVVDGEASICVRDFGMGIPETHLEKVFEPFRRLHRHDEVAGSGLGLTFCRDLLKRIGGEIRVESCKTQGTSFYIKLPLE